EKSPSQIGNSLPVFAANMQPKPGPKEYREQECGSIPRSVAISWYDQPTGVSNASGSLCTSPAHAILGCPNTPETRSAVRKRACIGITAFWPLQVALRSSVAPADP